MVFSAAIENKKPLVFWSDNGKENIAQSVHDFLSQNEIDHIRIVPGNPQSNGKIERFWPTIDNCLKGATTWEDVYERIRNRINDYNNNPHLGLPMHEFKMHHKTPEQVFSDRTLQAIDLDSTFIQIDNNQYSLRSFISHRK